MKKEEVEKIIKICYQIAKKNPYYIPEQPDTLVIKNSYFHLLAETIASQITIDEGEVKKAIKDVVKDILFRQNDGRDSRFQGSIFKFPDSVKGALTTLIQIELPQALKKADIIKVGEGNNG